MMRSLRLALLTVATTLLVGLVSESKAASVYSLTGATNYFQQAGNNLYYYGDDVTLAAGIGPQRLDNIQLLFGLASVGAYTTNLTLDIFGINPTTRLPNTGVLASANSGTLIFVGGGDPPPPCPTPDGDFRLHQPEFRPPD